MSYGRLGSGRPPRVSALSLSLALLGFCLAHGTPAHAGAVTVNPVQTTTYTLDPANNPITFGAHTKIQATSGNGVFDDSSTNWRITNYGLISTSGYDGLTTGHASSLTNYGTISGPAMGVALPSGSTVVNENGANILGGVGIAGSGKITNSGTITEFASAWTGTITNTATGVISSNSSDALLSANGSMLTNAGVISNAYTMAVTLGGGGAGWGAGSLNNTKTGQITAGTIAVASFLGSKSLTNAGEISGVEGVAMWEGGKLVNAAGGTISGSNFGVGDFGTYAGYASTIDNQNGATIEGSLEAVFFRSNAGATTLTNSGLITSPNHAVEIAGGSITNQIGGVISGSDAIVAAAAATTVINSGRITGAIFLDHGGAITNQSSGTIYGFVDSGGPITISNAGTWQLQEIFNSINSGGGTITNTGLIEGDPGLSGPEQFVIWGLSIFRNGSSGRTGTINLVNGIVGDDLLLEQPFSAATGHSILTLDAYLGGPGSQADELKLTQGSSGQTLIRIHDTNTGAGALNSSGIVLVTGATAASNFALDPKGPGYDKKNKGIDHGLFLYSLQFQSGNEVLVGTAAPAAHQLATAQTAGQTILAQTSFSPSGGASSGAGFAGFTGDGSVSPDRPMFWTAAVNTLSPDPLTQGRFVGAPGGSRIAPPPSLRLSAMQSSAGMDTGYDQGLAMLKGGVDLVRHRDGDKSFSLGVGTAYIQSDQRFTDGGAAMFYSGVVYGAYADWRSGSAHLSAAFKSAMLKAQYQASWLPNSNPSAGLTSTGVQIDGGTSFELAPGWRLEPIASMAASRTSMSDLHIAGELARFSSGYSGWANAGARLEGTARLGGYQLDGRVTARVWDRFGDNTAWLASLGSNSPLIDRISGVSGEVAAELRLSAGRNLYGFVQTSARSGAAQTAAMALAGLSIRW